MKSVINNLSWFHHLDRHTHPAGGTKMSSSSSEASGTELTMLDDDERSSSCSSSESSTSERSDHHHHHHHLVGIRGSCYDFCSDLRRCPSPPRSSLHRQGSSCSGGSAAANDATEFDVLVNGKKRHSLTSGSILNLLNYRQRRKKRSK